MPETFDPYHKWLGISPKDRPVNHYRLLGIDRFEDDPQVIDVAADRQMAHLRSFQSGPQGALSQKLLNEISAARLCLLNAEKKAAYDRTLQVATKPVANAKALPMAQPLSELPAVPKLTPATRPVVAAGSSASVPSPAAFETPIPSARTSGRRKNKPVWQQPVVWSAVLGAVALGLVGFLLFGNKPRQTDVAGNEKTEIAPSDGGATSPIARKVPGSEPEQQNEPEVAKVDPQPKVSTIKAKEPDSPSADSSREADTTKPAAKPESPVEGIDLLKPIDLQRDVIRGEWRMEGGSLISTAGDATRVVVGPALPERYRLDIDYKHMAGQAACVGLVLGDHHGLLLVNFPAHGALLNGMHRFRDSLIDHTTEGVPKELFSRGPLLEDRHGHLVCLVEPGRIWVTCNGKQVVNWSGDFSELSLFEPWEIPEKNRIFLGSHQAIIRYERAVLTPLKAWPKTMPGGNEPVPDEPIAKQPNPEEGAPKQPAASTTSLPTGIDLLKSLDLERDVIGGEWKLEDGDLISLNGAQARVAVGPAVSERYRLDIEYQRISGAMGCLGIVVGDHHTLLIVDCPMRDGGVISGFHRYRQAYIEESIEGFPEGSFTREPVLQEGHGRIICLVEPGRVWAACNGKEIVNWSGDFSQLGMYEFWDIPDKDRIFLGSHGASIRYERAILTPLKAWPSQLPLGNQPASVDSIARQAIPDAAAQQTVKAQLKEVFEKEYAAASRPEGKVVLAQQLIAAAAKSPMDAPERYVMFHEAGLLAADAADAKLLGQALAPLVEDYENPSWTVPLELLAQFAAAAKTTEAHKSFYALAMEWSRRALERNQYDDALKLAGDAATAAAKARDVDARKRVAAYRESVEKMQAGWPAAHAALEVLKKTPADPTANLTVGKFLCFDKQEWDAGLAHLARGSDQALQQLAKEDLQQREDSTARLALADRWWQAGEKLKGNEKTASHDRAAYWYLQAEPDLQGLEKARVAKKLKEMGVIVDVLSMIKPSRINARGNWLYDKKVLVSPSDPAAAIQFPYEPPTEYDVVLTAQRIKSQETINYGQDAFVFGLSHAGSQFLLVADWYCHGRSRDLAVYAVDDKGPGDQSPMHTYASIFGDKPVTVTVRVRNDRIKVEADGKQLANWAVDYSRLSLPKEWTPADRTQLFIGSRQCNFRITQFDVVQVTR